MAQTALILAPLLLLSIIAVGKTFDYFFGNTPGLEQMN